MKCPIAKRWEYWNHFIAQWIVDGSGGGHGITGARLRKAKDRIMSDDQFWADIVIRHGGLDMTPEEMKKRDSLVYDHCLGNFWGQVLAFIFWGTNE